MHHKDLEAWKKSIELVTRIYEVTKSFPEEEKYGIITQIRRAAVSIPSNIAEGAARNSNKEMCYFINIALGSLAELETQLIISEKLHYFNDTELYQQINKVMSLIVGLKKYLSKTA